MDLLQVEAQNFEHVRSSSQQRARPWTLELKSVGIVVLGTMCVSLVLVCYATPAALGGSARVAGKSLRRSSFSASGVGDLMDENGWKVAAVKDPLVQFAPAPFHPGVPSQSRARHPMSPAVRPSKVAASLFGFGEGDEKEEKKSVALKKKDDDNEGWPPRPPWWPKRDPDADAQSGGPSPFAGMGGPGGMDPMGLGRSQAKVQMVPDTGVTFADVVGVDQPKIELEETVQFLKESERFTDLGARIPRGLLLEGPPGTGKTLLARAVAGEAGVPFFSASGSEFVEMFVGVGASRVRDLFAQAKKNAPCIIFIDEIDALGGKRGGGMGGGNDEKEQTLNQLLTEMDGFEGNPGIIVIAATNRADVLDDALLRPGRFDRRITVNNPDFKGRVEILGVHSRNKPLADDVDMEQVARRTPGFSGAMLANVLNEAAIYAARREDTKISNMDISNALDRVTIGLQKKGVEQSLQMRELVAFHEAGHAILGALMPDYDQVAKITITPRGGAGGLTFFAPSEIRTDSGMYSVQYLKGILAVALGGRIAEEIVFGEDAVTTGASNDLERVSSTAKSMVTEYGMSPKIGQVALGTSQPGMQAPPISGATKQLVDAEVNELVQEAYTRGKQLLLDNRKALDALSAALLEKETVDGKEFAQIMNDHGIEVKDFSVLGQVKELEEAKETEKEEQLVASRRLQEDGGRASKGMVTLDSLASTCSATPRFTFKLLDEKPLDHATGLHPMDTQFIAALGDPMSSSGADAGNWGIWLTDPGQGGVHLHNWKRIEGAGGVAPAQWVPDRNDLWVQEHGLMMDKPFALSPGKYRVIAKVGTTLLTVFSDGRWELEGGAKLQDVTHLACQFGRYIPTTSDASPANARVSDFPGTFGGMMPNVQGYDKLDYNVIAVTGYASP